MKTRVFLLFAFISVIFVISASASTLGCQKLSGSGLYIPCTLSISVNPTSAIITQGSSQTFTATVSGYYNGAVILGNPLTYQWYNVSNGNTLMQSSNGALGQDMGININGGQIGTFYYYANVTETDVTPNQRVQSSIVEVTVNPSSGLTSITTTASTTATTSASSTVLPTTSIVPSNTTSIPQASAQKGLPFADSVAIAIIITVIVIIVLWLIFSRKR